MLSRLPVLPTLVVLAAVAVMVRLGFWQLERKAEKEGLLARYERAIAMSSTVAWPRDSAAADRALYRHTRIDCVRVIDQTTVSGQDFRGTPGIAHVARCALAGGGVARVVMGWSRQPGESDWSGGTVDGVIAPGPRLVATPALAGLGQNRLPSPADLPNNHLAYAVQWFLFALTALVIYGLALRKRLAGAEAAR
ncbi:MAG: SURF1 family protein [Novosphingobium sp.]